VDRPESPWTDGEIAEVFRALRVCSAWLARQASRYRVALDAGSDGLYYHTEDPQEDEVPLGFRGEAGRVTLVSKAGAAHALAVASRWVSRVGFRDIVRFVGHVQRSVAADSWVVLFHPREAGRSFAIPAEISLHRCVELAVCYAQHAPLRGEVRGRIRPSPSTYAHELLHLFGATDKYDVVSLDDFPPGSVTERDIMRCSHYDLEHLRIDPLTAAEIGWPADAR
jgi:hypothetical protein